MLSRQMNLRLLSQDDAKKKVTLSALKKRIRLCNRIITCSMILLDGLTEYLAAYNYVQSTKLPVLNCISIPLRKVNYNLLVYSVFMISIWKDKQALANQLIQDWWQIFQRHYIKTQRHCIKTLGIPTTRYRTTTNLYWLLDTIDRGFTYPELRNNVRIATIRVSKNPTYGYFNIGELFINKRKQIAYRISKSSISFLIENLDITWNEVVDGFTKLGLWYKGITEVKYYNGVINRSHQRKLANGQLDILTDRVLHDLGVEITGSKDEIGSYALTKNISLPYYTPVEPRSKGYLIFEIGI